MGFVFMSALFGRSGLFCGMDEFGWLRVFGGCEAELFFDRNLARAVCGILTNRGTTGWSLSNIPQTTNKWRHSRIELFILIPMTYRLVVIRSVKNIPGIRSLSHLPAKALNYRNRQMEISSRP
jgi:hypothetical protein